MTPRRVHLGFAIANVLPALTLGIGCYALPFRWWAMDLPLSLIVALLLASSAITVFRRRSAPLALAVAAWALLVVGLGLVAAFGLSAGFLSGVHGAFGALGVVLMLLVLLLILPYAVVYPSLELLWLKSQRAQATSASGSSGAKS